MKEYFVTFCIAFFMSVAVCFFHTFHSVYITALGGIPLAAVAWWRLVVVAKQGLSPAKHTAAFMLGWFFLFMAVLFPMLTSTLGSVMTYSSFGLATLLACITFIFRRKRIMVAAISLIIWLTFVLTVLPAWKECVSKWPRHPNGTYVIQWNK